MVGGTGRYWENQGCCGCRVLGGTGALGASGRGVWAEQRALKSAGYWEALGGMGGSGVGGCMEGGPRGSGWGLRECQGPAPLPVMSSAPNGGASLGRSGGGTWVLRVVAVGAGDQTRGLGGVKCHQPPRGRGAEPLPPRPPPHPLSASWGPTGSGCWGVPGPLDTLGVGVPPPCWVPRAPPGCSGCPPGCAACGRSDLFSSHSTGDRRKSRQSDAARRCGGGGRGRGVPPVRPCAPTHGCAPPDTRLCPPPPTCAMEHTGPCVQPRHSLACPATLTQPHSHSAHTHTLVLTSSHSHSAHTQLALTHTQLTHTHSHIHTHTLTLSSHALSHTLTHSYSHSAHTHAHTHPRPRAAPQRPISPQAAPGQGHLLQVGPA